jgi:hypothetical protein
VLEDVLAPAPLGCWPLLDSFNGLAMGTVLGESPDRQEGVGIHSVAGRGDAGLGIGLFGDSAA